MAEGVLDASAMLAFVHGEPGGAFVARFVGTSSASAINLAEAASRLVESGLTEAEARTALGELALGRVVPFDAEAAFRCAALRLATRAAGLSLGDRACLDLARELHLPAITADRSWTSLALAVEVQLIR
jgi:PIN domain nuclease of toxin-antitoxin system